MLLLLRRSTGGLRGHGIWRLVGKVTLASAAMGMGVRLAVGWMSPVLPPGLMGEVLLVGGGGLVGGGIYGLLAILLRVEEVELLCRIVVERTRRLTGS